MVTMVTAYEFLENLHNFTQICEPPLDSSGFSDFQKCILLYIFVQVLLSNEIA